MSTNDENIFYKYKKTMYGLSFKGVPLCLENIIIKKNKNNNITKPTLSLNGSKIWLAETKQQAELVKYLKKSTVIYTKDFPYNPFNAEDLDIIETNVSYTIDVPVVSNEEYYFYGKISTNAKRKRICYYKITGNDIKTIRPAGYLTKNNMNVLNENLLLKNFNDIYYEVILHYENIKSKYLIEKNNIYLIQNKTKTSTAI